MSLNYEIRDPQSGQESKADPLYVGQHLGQMGYQVLGTSADGSQLTIQGAQGPYEIPVDTVIQKMGFEVMGKAPLQPTFEAVNPKWRAAVTKLPDDDMRQAYLKTKLVRDLGWTDPQIVGTGDDWYAFNPKTSRWDALTNAPGMDVADIAGTAAEAPRFLGSVGGGIIGGGLGGPTPVALATGAAGSAAGGALGDLASRGIMGAIDPDYAEVALANKGRIAEEMGVNAAVDAATGGLVSGAGALLPKFFSQAVKRGVVSPTMKATGGALEGLGGGAAAVAKGIRQSPTARTWTAALNPMTTDLDMLGFLAQLPSSAARGGARGIGKLAETGVLGEAGSRSAKNLSQQLLSKRGAEYGVMSEAPVDVFGNIFERGARGIAKLFKNPSKIRTQTFREAREYGIPAEEAFRIGQQAEMDANLRLGTIGARAGKAGENVGKVLGAAEQAGKGAVSLAEGLTDVGLRGVQGVGLGLQGTGALMRQAGRFGAYEVPGAARIGAEEALERAKRLRRQPLTGIMEPESILASTY